MTTTDSRTRRQVVFLVSQAFNSQKMATERKSEEISFAMENLSVSTRLIHGDANQNIANLDSSTRDGGLSPMISTATTFDMHASFGGSYTYTRHNQPTRARLEHLFTKIENGTSSIIYPSGVSAIRSLFEYYKPKRLITNRGYKGSLGAIDNLIEQIKVLKDENINIEYLENELEPKLSSNDIVFIECPSNPYLTIFDISPLSKYIHSKDSKIIIDATVATPVIFQPFKHGVDIIVHSLTKFIGGHSDICGGVVIFNHKINANLCADSYKLHTLRTRYGNILGNLETWLLLRSLRSLSSRIRIQSINACKIAQFLNKKENALDLIEAVYHTSLKSHPNQDLAKKYFEKDTLYFNGNNEAMVIHPGLICIICNTEKIARSLVKGKFSLIIHATSFGGVETTIDLRSKFDSEIDPRCLRLSVGLESYEDIINDFKNAFKLTKKEQLEQQQLDEENASKQNKKDKKSKKAFFKFGSKK